MKPTLIVLILGLLTIGCVETPPLRELSEAEKLEEENRRIEAQLKNDKLKAELEAENKKKTDDLVRLSVVGEYEYKDIDGATYKEVFLANGVYEYHFNGKKEDENKWSIVDGEIHIKYGAGVIAVYRINADKSITWIADIDDGKRGDLPKGDGFTWKKIK